jgi:hypothetical protein
MALAPDAQVMPIVELSFMPTAIANCTPPRCPTGMHYRGVEAHLGLGRTVASHHPSTTLYQIFRRYSVPRFLKRRCDRTLGAPAQLAAVGRPGRRVRGAHGGARARSRALSLCTAAHPIYTRLANIFGAPISGATMRERTLGGAPRHRGARRVALRGWPWAVKSI